jgi:glucose/arabinose dehydrogenase
MRARLLATIVGVVAVMVALVLVVGAYLGIFFTNPTVTSGEPVTVPPAAVTTIASDLEAPWGVAFLPDGTALVTERDTARILSIGRDGAPTEVQRLAEVDPGGEGGLLGIAVSPGYDQDRWVYVYYTAADDNRVMRLHLGEAPQPLLTGIPKSGNHNGGRIKFGPDGMLYVGTGDAGDRGRAQDRDSLGGKILRITPDGQPAPGNPFEGSPVYSYGHRNVQGLAWDGGGQLYAAEFGQNRYDELNRIQAGGNYGWPLVEGTGDDEDYINPIATWSTSDASPSGIAILGDRVFIACLRGTKLYRIGTDGQGAQGLFDGEYGRIRDVVVAPDNMLWVLTSNRDGRGSPTDTDDRVLRLDPAQI